MRKFYLVILIVVLVFSLATPAMAGGDKNHGDNDSPPDDTGYANRVLNTLCDFTVDVQRCKSDSP
jgi:hypothetical protein